MTRKLPYSEGTWFAVPLLSGGYAVGVAARMDGHGQVLGYFFGPVREAIPELSEVVGLSPADNALILQFGDLELIQGDWPVIGQHPEWDRQAWPFPAFYRTDLFTAAMYQVEYDEDSFAFREERLIDPADAIGLAEDGLYGAEAARYVITNRLAQEP